MAELAKDVVIDTRELPAGDHMTVSIDLPAQFIIVFEPVTLASRFIDVQGEPTDQVQHLSLKYDGARAKVEPTVLRPGPLQLTLDNKAGVRVLPTAMVAADALHHMNGRRKPCDAAKRVLSNK